MKSELSTMVFAPLETIEAQEGPRRGYGSHKAHADAATHILAQLPPRFQLAQRLRADNGYENLSEWIDNNGSGSLTARFLHYFATELEEAPNRGYFAWLDEKGHVMPRVSYSCGVTNWEHSFTSCEATKEAVGEKSWAYYVQWELDYRRTLENLVCEYIHPESRDDFGSRPDKYYCANLGSYIGQRNNDLPIKKDVLKRMGFKLAFVDSADIFDPEIISFIKDAGGQRSVTIANYIGINGFWRSLNYFRESNPEVMGFLARSLLGHTFQKYGPQDEYDDPEQVKQALRYLRGRDLSRPDILASSTFKKNLSFLERKYAEKPEQVPAL